MAEEALSLLATMKGHLEKGVEMLADLEARAASR